MSYVTPLRLGTQLKSQLYRWHVQSNQIECIPLDKRSEWGIVTDSRDEVWCSQMIYAL